MARVFLAPDGNEWYKLPTTVKEANEWLERVGVRHIKFGTRQGRPVLKNALAGTKYNNTVYMESTSIQDICCYLVLGPNQLRVFGIPARDWWLPENMQFKNEVIIYGHCDGRSQWMVPQ